MVSFNTTVEQMTEKFQCRKCLSKKWQKCFGEKKFAMVTFICYFWLQDTLLAFPIFCLHFIFAYFWNLKSAHIYQKVAGPCTSRL